MPLKGTPASGRLPRIEPTAKSAVEIHHTGEGKIVLISEVGASRHVHEMTIDEARSIGGCLNRVAIDEQMQLVARKGCIVGSI